MLPPGSGPGRRMRRCWRMWLGGRPLRDLRGRWIGAPLPRMGTGVRRQRTIDGGRRCMHHLALWMTISVDCAVVAHPIPGAAPTPDTRPPGRVLCLPPPPPPPCSPCVALPSRGVWGRGMGCTSPCPLPWPRWPRGYCRPCCWPKPRTPHRCPPLVQPPLPLAELWPSLCPRPCRVAP